MPRKDTPAVTLEDARAWEAADLPDECYYHYSVTVTPGYPRAIARVSLVWIPVKGHQLVLLHEGEPLVRGRPELITGAWIRAQARLQGRITREGVQALINRAQWELESHLAAIRAPRP